MTDEKFGICPECGVNTLSRDVPMMHKSASGKVMPSHIDQMTTRVEKLSLGPNDLIIVRDEADMDTFIQMTNQGIGFSPYANPILLIRGGLEKATRQDLIEALSVMDQMTEGVSRIITDLHAPALKKVQ
jgi:hypothetical protein